MDKKKYNKQLDKANMQEFRLRWLWAFLLLLASIVSASNAKK